MKSFKLLMVNLTFLLFTFLFFYFKSILGLNILLLLIYCYYIYVFIKKNNTGHPMVLYLITFGLFNLGRILLTVLGLSTYKYTNWMKFIKFSDETLLNLSIIYILSLITIGFTGIIINKNQKIKIKEKKIGIEKYLFCLGFIMSILKGVYGLIFVIKNGYALMYITGIDYPIYLKGAIVVLTISYYKIITNIISLKKFKLYSILFLIAYFITSLKGNRGDFILQIFIVYYYYRKIYGRQIKFKKIFKYSSIFILLLSFLNILRSDKIRASIPFYKKIQIFISDQGVTLTTLGFTIEYKEKIETIIQRINTNVLFEPLKLGYFQNPKKYFGYNISTFLNPEMVKNGSGIGSNNIAELYITYGELGVLLGSFLIVLFIYILEKSSYKSREILFLNSVFYYYLFWSPRGNYFFNINRVLIYLCIYFIIDVVNKICYKRWES